MTKLTVHLLGQFQVLLNGKAITHFATDKVRALLAYLVIENQYPHRREKLATLFWPEKSESEARTNLRRALADLRANIQDQATSPPFLLITRNDIQINLASSITIDCLLLEHQAHNGCKTQQDMEQCDRLLALYRGEFLAGFSLPGCIAFDDWQSLVREQYHRMVVLVVEKAMQYLDQHQQYQRAIPYGRRLVSLAPWQEDHRRQLMQLLALAGDRQEALQQYEDLKATLAEELGLEPELVTTQLMETIRAGVFPECQAARETILTAPVPDRLAKEWEAPSPLQKTFVGRSQVLAALHAKLAEILRSGNGSVHCLAGEAGSGKTWLGREFISQALEQHPDLVAAVGFCNAFTGSGDPYLPFREILSQFCGDFESQTNAGMVTRAYAFRLWNNRGTAAQIVLNYGHRLVETIIPGYVLLSQPLFHVFESQGWYTELKDLVKEQQKSSHTPQYTLLLSQLATVLQKIAQRSPLILAIDDLHWADTGTLNLLMHLGKHLAGSPILILCAFRSEEVFLPQGEQVPPLLAVLHELQREHGDILADLDELPGREFITEYLASEPNVLAPDYGDYLYRLTAGHALSVSELLRTFQEDGSLVKDEEGRWVENGQRAIEQLPPKIEGILAMRIQDLPPVVQHYLSLASIQGEVFNAEVIARVSGQKAQKVIQLLNHTVTREHHLIQWQQAPLGGKRKFTVYKFHHILYQKYLYDNLTADESAQRHGQVGDALEALLADDTEPCAGQLARHFHQAGRFEKAIPYYRQAARRAKRMAGCQEAATLLETALTLIQQLPASKERDQQELRLQMDISLAYMMLLGTGHAQVKKANERAWELCQTLEADEQRLDVLEILTQYPAARADYERCYEILALIDQIRSEMKEIPPHEKIRQAWKDAHADFIFGRFKSCVHNAGIALHVYYETQEPGNEVLLGDVGIMCHHMNFLASCVLGNFQDAVNNLQKIARIMKTINDKNFFLEGLTSVVQLNLFLQEYEKLAPLHNFLVKISGDDYFPNYEGLGRVLQANILEMQHDYDQAIQEYTRVIQIELTRGQINSLSINYLILADTYLKKGDVENAKQAFDNAVDNQKNTGETFNISDTARVEGNLLQAEGQLTAAEEKYREAIHIAQEQSARTFELYAVEALCQLWHRQGKTQQAHQRLSAMLAQFEGQPNVGILREARKLLATFQVTPTTQ